MASDTFNRADSPSLGAPWSESETPGHPETLEIATNRLRMQTSAVALRGFAVFDLAPMEPPDQFSELTFRLFTGGNINGAAGVLVRASGTEGNTTAYFAGVRQSDRRVQLFKFVAQAFMETVGTLLAEAAAPLADNDILRLEVKGLQLTVKVNGAVVIGPLTDSAIAGPGKVGVGFANSAAIATTLVFDDWSGGDVGLPIAPRLWALPVEALEGTAVATRLRRALVSRLQNDPQLAGALGGATRIFHRPRLMPPERPVLTYFDFGARPDPTVPLLDRTIQVDVWGAELDQAEQIAAHVKRLLHNQPLSVGGVVQGVYLQLVSDRDDIAEEGDLARKTQEYRLLAYELVG